MLGRTEAPACARSRPRRAAPRRRHHDDTGWTRALPRLLVLALLGPGCSGRQAVAPEDDTSSSTAADTTQAPPDPSTTTLRDTTGPDPSTSTAASTTDQAPLCGNGVVDPGEQCDGDDLDGQDCSSLLAFEGTLGCQPTCFYDIAGCIPAGMILIPAGTFEMGANGNAFDELPVRQVELQSFFIDETEVRVIDYAECVNAGQCSQPGTGLDCNWLVPGRDSHPINCVDHGQATAYCDWAGYLMPKRLPTEAEWEKAARGTEGAIYPWGDDPLPSCTHIAMNEGMGGGCGAGSSIPVGSKPLGASPYGVQDMAGSIWNWVADWYGPYDVGDTVDPTGPSTGTLRVMRGGGWDTVDIVWFRGAARNPQPPSNSNRNVGFRCAQSLPPPP